MVEGFYLNMGWSLGCLEYLVVEGENKDVAVEEGEEEEVVDDHGDLDVDGDLWLDVDVDDKDFYSLLVFYFG